eukprot:jgi/Botrbrau1/10218/Bobra.0362s0008.1
MDLDSALNCALDADPETRRLGEHWLKLLESTPGSLLATIAFAIDKSKAQGQRQLAAIISQRLVKQFWSGRGGDESSGISPEDKRTISSLLLGGLKDPDSKLRTALGFTIALIVGHDTFDASRDLLLWLAAALKDEKDPNLIDGAVQCLQMVIEEISVDETLKALPLLCPPLVDVLQRPNCVHPDVGSASLAILSTLVETSCIRAAHQQAAKSHISAYIPLLMGIASTVLDEPVSPLVIENLVAKMEAATLLRSLANCFPQQQLAGDLLAIQGQAINSVIKQLTACIPFYQRNMVHNDVDLPQEVDRFGETIDFPNLICRLFDVLGLLLSARLAYDHKLVLAEGRLATSLQLAFYYLQLPHRCDSWIYDPEQYIECEEETMDTIRDDAEGFICTIMEFGLPLGSTFRGIIESSWNESESLKAAGSPGWYKPREALLFGLGCNWSPMRRQLQSVGFDFASFVEAIVQRDLNDDSIPLLKGRAFWFISKVGLPSSQAAFVLQKIAAAIKLYPVIPPVVGACKALTGLIRKAAKEQTQFCLQEVFDGLVRLLAVDSELLRHVVLETLASAIKADPVTATAFEPRVTQAVLDLWSEDVADPLLSGDAIDVLHSLAQSNQARSNMHSTALPYLAKLVANPSGLADTTLVAGAIDVTCALLRPSTKAEAERLHSIMTPPVMAQLQGSDDDAILQESCDYLRVLFEIGGRDVLSWGAANPSYSLDVLVSLVASLLHPRHTDSSCMLVGSLLLAMLRSMQDLMGAYIPRLLPLLITRLANTTHAMTRHGLVMVMAHIGRSNPRELLDFLLSTGTTEAEQHAAVQFVLKLWTEWQGDLNGYYAILLSTAGLAALLASQHPILTAVELPGRRLDLNTGIRTRSKAALMPEQYEMVPADAKIFSLLVDALEEAVEGGSRLTGVASDGDDDSEWEEDTVGQESAVCSPHPAGHNMVQHHDDGGEDEGPRSLPSRVAAVHDVPRDDPLSDADMVQFLKEQIVHLQLANRARFAVWLEALTQGQRESLQRCMR